MELPFVAVCAISSVTARHLTVTNPQYNPVSFMCQCAYPQFAFLLETRA